MRRKFVLLALLYPGLKLLLLRRTLPELRENHVIPLIAELQGIAKYNAEEKAFTFPNSSRLKLGYCDTEADVYQYQGQEYDVIGLEEATHFTESQMQFLTTCNRSTRTDFKPRMHYTANPGNVGHAWFKRLFIDRDYRQGENQEDYVFIPARVYDNKVLMETNPEYVRTLEALPDDLRRAHLDGDWDVFAGQYFREFRRDKHVIDPFEIPSWWKRFRSIDWGYNDPCAVYWHAVGPDRRVYTYRELYVREMTASQLAAKITEMSFGEQIDYTVMSPDAWAKRGNDAVIGESIAETLHKAGVYVVKADNNRLSGWMRMREYLRDAPDSIPYWQIFSTCHNLIRILPQLVHDDHNVEDVSDKCEDHAAESCRYALMSRPPISETPVKPKPQLPFALRTDEEIRQEGKTWLSWEQ
jgi:phage terminase large subunit